MKHKPTLAKQTKRHPVKGQVIARNEPRTPGEPTPGPQKSRVKKGKRG